MLRQATVTTFTNNDVNSGDVVLASHHNEQGSRIAAVLNGGIENDNIAANAAIAGSKLADGSVTAAKIGLSTQSYTPVLTAATSNPNIGSTGTITGKYTQIGKWTVGEVLISVSGTGISSGSGVYFVSLPTEVSGTFHTANVTAGTGSAVGAGYFRDDSPSSGSLLIVPAVATLNGGSGGVGTVLLMINASRSITESVSLASGDRFTFNFAYMAA